MNNKKWLIGLGLAVLTAVPMAACPALCRGAYVFTDFNVPSSMGPVGLPDGVYGNDIVGAYIASNGVETGFLYDGSNSTFTSLIPGVGDISDVSTGIWGSTIVGNVRTPIFGVGGYVYNGVNYAGVVYPGSFQTTVRGIYESTVVGQYFSESTGGNGFVYNGSTFVTVHDPLGVISAATGSNGNVVVGNYSAANNIVNGFIYNGSFATLDDPLGVGGTVVQGIYNNTIVGYYVDANSVSHGFVYNGSTFVTVDDPMAASGADEGTEILGIYGNTLVGAYYDADMYDADMMGEHGFIATLVPEPASLSLFALLPLICRRARRRH